MIGTNPNLILPLASDNLAAVVAKTAAALSALATSITDKATPAAINVTQDLSLAGNNLTNVNSLQLAAGVAPTAAGSVYYSGGEFWMVDQTSAVQITALGALNLSGIGGIGGQYASVGALVYYDDTTKRYLMQQEIQAGTRPYAGVATGPLDVYDTANPAPTNRVRLASVASLGANVTVTLPTVNLTLPTAQPAANAFLRQTPTGAINTSSLVTVTGTVPIMAASINGNSVHTSGSAPFTIATVGLTAGATAAVVFPLPVLAGDTITGYTVWLNKGSNATITITSQLVQQQTWSISGDSAGATNNANAPGNITLSESGLSVGVGVNQAYAVAVYSSANDGSTVVMMCSYTVTR